MRVLRAVGALVALAGLLGCGPKNGGLGGACSLGACDAAKPMAFCQTVDDACDPEPGPVCVGVIATGGTCSRPCVRDDDCRGAVVPMVCSNDCLRDAKICVRVEDARSFCQRTSPPVSCVDLHLRGDGLCDGPSGTNLCADDADDCGPTEPWAAACAASCQHLRGAACPLDDLSDCEARCTEGVEGFPACRAQAKALYECSARDDAHACGDDQKSHPTGLCAAETTAMADCERSFSGT
jgi:hypothetical protein